MKKTDWNEVLDHLDPALVEEYVTQKARLGKRTKPKKAWLRLGVIAACVALIFAACILVPMMRRDDIGGMPNENTAESNTTVTESTSKSPISPDDACYVKYYFYSVRDLDTYVATGSTNPEDYKVTYITAHPPGSENDQVIPLGPNLEGMPSPEKIQEHGYASLFDFFTFNETDFDRIVVCFRCTEYGYTTYGFILDELSILMRPTKPFFEEQSRYDSTASLYAAKHDIPISNDSDPVLDPDHETGSTYQIRKYGEYDVVYKITDGIKEEAGIIVNGFYIEINIASSAFGASAEQRDAEYTEFITNPKYAPFAALFADDQETFEAAVMSMVEKAAAEN